jgi:hypothetical protein
VHGVCMLCMCVEVRRWVEVCACSAFLSFEPSVLHAWARFGMYPWEPEALQRGASAECMRVLCMVGVYSEMERGR